MAKEMVQPERAKTKPKKIAGKGNPGGPATPGARAKSGKTIAQLAEESNNEHDQGTHRSR